MQYVVTASKLYGNVHIPPSKSNTLRAIVFASLAEGKSIIHHYLQSPDTHAMIHACRLLGATITIKKNYLIIIGVNSEPKTPPDVIHAGNSGQVFRFIAAIAALTPGFTVLTGDHSVRTNRPIQPLLNGLKGLNAFAVSTKNDGHAPIIVKGPLSGGVTTLEGEDSQPVSGLLIASAFSPGKTVIHVENPGETPWIDLTLHWFKKLCIPYKKNNYTFYELLGGAHYPGFEYTVPGDFSSCAFPLIAAIITQSEIALHNLDMTDAQGDKKMIDILQAMGANIDVRENSIYVKKSTLLRGQQIDMNPLIDAIPIMAVMACFSKEETLLTNVGIARKKESDRLSTITLELKKMGADIREHKDALMIKPAKLKGAKVNSHNDHRIAMSLVVAGLAAEGEVVVNNPHCIDKSYPFFMKSFQQLGANIRLLK